VTLSTRSGIPTTYRETNFRSRLEARWAAFFDLVGWHWTYEPFDAGGYAPDFLVHGKGSLLLEVGPCVDYVDYVEKSTKAAARAEALGRDLLVVGVSPLAPSDGLNDWSRMAPHNPVAGYLGEYHPTIRLDYPGDGSDSEPAGFGWNTGLWGRCYDCLALGVVHVELSFHLRPCGHHQSGSYGELVDGLFLEDLWAQAGNAVQWQR
jgi:hypothetical protein